jgi:hypothetical protein
MKSSLSTGLAAASARRSHLASPQSPINVSTPPIRIIGFVPRPSGGFCLSDR